MLAYRIVVYFLQFLINLINLINTILTHSPAPLSLSGKN